MGVSSKWELDSIFLGGSSSKAFRTFLDAVQESIHNSDLLLKGVLHLDGDDPAWLSTSMDIYELLNRIKLQLKEADSYIECLLVQNTEDAEAAELRDKLYPLQTEFNKVVNDFQKYLGCLPADCWADLLESANDDSKASLLMLKQSEEKMLEPQFEEMLANLSVSGYHAWENMYNVLINRIYLKNESFQMLLVDPDRRNRHHIYLDYMEKSEEESQFFAIILNSIAGYRLDVDQVRGRHSPLSEAVIENRVQLQTIETMMDVVIDRAKEFGRYFTHKAGLLGIDRFSWYDIAAQVNRYSEEFPIDRAAKLVTRSLSQSLPRLGGFAARIFEKSWIDTEDRANKSFAIREVYFPSFNQARITIRYNNQFSLLPLIAHEIGHAYHDGRIADQSGFLQDVPLSLAETASTLSEFMMLDGARQYIQDKQGQLGLLENKIQTAIINLILIPIRYIFERNFYEQRKKGSVSVSTINELMVDAQRKVLGDDLETYDPYMWIYTRHFYFTRNSFYNFPYVMGHCISNTFFSKRNEPDILDRYDGFLKDSGRYSVEELVHKYLNEDITKPKFWERAYEEVVKDIDEFIKLTGSES